jgi:hypothetical protein
LFMRECVAPPCQLSPTNHETSHTGINLPLLYRRSTYSNVTFSLRTKKKKLLRLDTNEQQSRPRAYDSLLERSLISGTPP